MPTQNQNTPNLGVPYIAAAQAQKHVTHNEALRILDALIQLAIVRRDLTAPPTTPNDGTRYIVAANATGTWSGQDQKIAAWQDGGWTFYTPQEGWTGWITAEDLLVVWDGSDWSAINTGSGGGGATPSVNPAPLVGVNTVADVTNRLSVKSDATLLSHDDVTPGSGDQRLVINKAGTPQTASLMFQNNFSGRAEIGLTGDDALSIKTSADGVNWRDAVTIDADGLVAMPHAASSKRVRLASSVNQAFPSGALTPVTFDIVDYDTAGFFTPSQATRITIPAGVSLIVAYAGVAMGQNITATIYSELRFTIRSSTGTVKTTVACAQQNMVPVKCSGPMPVSQGDWLEISFYQGAGTTNVSQSAYTFLAVETLA